jgi:predicted transcriptional regulator
MDQLLMNAGLNEAQAAVYLFLLERSAATPPVVAGSLKLTRTNAYKVLDSLLELGLVQKLEIDKKFVYKATDPSALASLVAEKRNQVIALEQNIKQAMQELQAKYRKSSGNELIESQTGSEALVAAYEQQAQGSEPIYFVKTRADIPFLGFETMDRLRTMPAKRGTLRFGITPDVAEAPADQAIDAGANLTRTWIPAEDYLAPVEWTASGSELLIQIFTGVGQVIRIQNQQVAESFRQMWRLIDKNVRANPAYIEIPSHAKRLQ